MSKTKHPTKIYRVPLQHSGMGCYFGIMGAFLSAVFAGILLEQRFSPDDALMGFIVMFGMLGCIAVPLTFMGFWLMYTTFMTRLIVTQEGIHAAVGAKKVCVAWDNMLRFEKEYTDETVRFGIILHEAVDVGVNEMSGIFDTADNFLRLGSFMPKQTRKRTLTTDDIVAHPLGADIMRYAPHLFDDLPEKDKRNE